jgi:NADH:ubiquinone oxidoreductase subunit 5 (subunit L)/multisubunit Na+/H+ antiporter MnhA subunit
MKAIIVNRISDSALYLGLFIIFFLFKTLDFPILSVCSNFLIDYKGKTLGLIDSFIEDSAFELYRVYTETEIIILEGVNMGVYSGSLFDYV